MRLYRKKLAQLIGLFSAIVSGGVLLMFMTYLAISNKVDSSAHIVLSLLLVLCVAAGWTAVTSRPYLLMLVFLVSFVPVGMYLLLIDSWVRIVGLAQVGYAVAAMMMLKDRKSTTS